VGLLTVGASTGLPSVVNKDDADGILGLINSGLNGGSLELPGSRLALYRAFSSPNDFDEFI
jgi:hypothetical protein